MQQRSRTGWRVIALALALALVSAQGVLAAPVDTAAPAQVQAADITVAPSSFAPSTPVDSDAITTTLDPNTQAFRDELATKQARLAELEAQLAELDKQVEIASEAYKAAEERLSGIKDQLATAKTDLENAAAAYDKQATLLGERAGDIYRQGELHTMDVLLGSDSLADLFKRVQFLTTISGYSADLASQLRDQRESIAENQIVLEQAAKEAEALEFDLRARKIEIELRYAEREEMLASSEADLVEMLKTEAARRAAEEAALYGQILSGAGNLGIQVTPGSPIETALAYHGVPYLWAGETPAAFDCSGLVLYVFKQHGVYLPHYSGSQFLLGQRVESWELQPGDAVFFGSPIHHVGIYLGAGYYIHAPKSGDFVKVSRLADRGDFAGARRYDWQPRTSLPEGTAQINANRVNHEAGIDLPGITK